MLTQDELLLPLARYRTDEIVVTTMSVTRPWGRISDRDLDFASADSAMGHAADLALGIALAQPQRTVVCLNGDGSMLMSLGTLSVAVGTHAANFVLFVLDNGTLEISGNQPHAGAGKVDFSAMAKAAGFPLVFKFDDPVAYAEAIPDLLSAPGPVFVHVLVEQGTEGPISRSSSEHARYLQSSLAGWSRTMRTALGIE